MTDGLPRILGTFILAFFSAMIILTVGHRGYQRGYSAGLAANKPLKDVREQSELLIKIAEMTMPDEERNYYNGYADGKEACENSYGFPPPAHGL